MKFRINRKDFFAREEEMGTMSVIVLKTNQILHFNRAGRHVFDTCDEWVDLDAFLAGLNAVKTTPEKLRTYFEDLLYKLCVCGLAALKEMPAQTGNGYRLAQKKDFFHVSNFLLANAAAGCSCAAMLDAIYNSAYSVYTRITGQEAAYLINEENGKILSLMEINRGNTYAGSTALNIQTVVFDQSLDRDAADAQLKILSDFAAGILDGQCTKLRYAHMHPRQDATRDALLNCGFVCTARFSEELKNGRDLVFYDRFITP